MAHSSHLVTPLVQDISRTITRPTEIEEVEPPHSLTWQLTQIEEVEPPHSLTSPLHTLTHCLTSRTRRTGPGIMDRVIALFSSGGGHHKKNHQPTTEEKKMLKEICARNKPTEIEEVEPPHSLTWQPTQIEEVEPPHFLTSPLHTLTSRTRRTGSGIMDRVIARFSSGGGRH
uniref:Uncharacterized protein n=1 Tax=Fagus sylvatica TaxID=28930 RepID=A0A2N9FKB1_FAGSY